MRSTLDENQTRGAAGTILAFLTSVDTKKGTSGACYQGLKLGGNKHRRYQIGNGIKMPAGPAPGRFRREHSRCFRPQ